MGLDKSHWFSEMYYLIDLFTAGNSHVLCNFFNNLLYPID